MDGGVFRSVYLALTYKRPDRVVSDESAIIECGPLCVATARIESLSSQ
jgi:hypothetical protein